MKAARTDATGGQLLAVSRTLAPTIIDDACQVNFILMIKKEINLFFFHSLRVHY